MLNINRKYNKDFLLFFQLLGDVAFQNGFDKALHLHLELSDTPVYTYYLQYEISFSIVKALLKQKFQDVEFKGNFSNMYFYC